MLLVFRSIRRTLYVVCALALLIGVTRAQDAQQVLRLSVGYNTLRNSTSLDPQKTLEVERLAKLAQAANASKNYGEALKCFYHAMSLMRGKEWTVSAELTSSMAVELATALPEQGDKDQVKLRSIYKVEQKPDGPVTGSIVLLKSDSETVAQLATIDKIEADLNAKPMEWTVTIPEIPDGAYKLRVSVKPGSGEEAKKEVQLHIERGLARRIHDSQAVAQTLQSNIKAAAMRDALSTAEYRLDLYKLASASDINIAHIDFDKELLDATHELAELNLGHDPYENRQGDFRRAYLSSVDNSLQPYRIFIPTSYTGAKPFPLVVALHGMGGDENSVFDQYGDGAFKAEAEKRGYIVVCPKGRKPASMYFGDAQKDVLDVIEAVERDYSIDRGRVYLTGHSMGGYGTWSIAMDHPDLFTAIAPISGGGNTSRMKLIAHIPALVVHGDADKTVPVQRSREMVEAGKKAGEEIKYDEVAGGSHVSVAVPAFKEIFDWFDSHPRKGMEGSHP
ncbi:MAG TPA: prolyl oligopeptidase family serine peptidase [Blastocatellia bacterium]